MATALASFTPEVAAMPITLVASVSTTKEKEVNRLRDLKTSARDQLMIDPRIILVDDNFNPRDYSLPENHAHLDELKRSIRENGVLVPLLVRFDPARKAAVLCDGECRLRAVLELIAEGVEILTVPTVQVPGGNEQDRLLIAITANTGKPLSKWELGNAFQRLYNFGWDEPRIAVKTGYGERFIREAMELSDAPEEVKQLLSSQAVTPSLALAELRANGAAAVETLKAAANAAQSNGQKTAKRAKAKTLPPAKPQTENDTTLNAVQAKSKPANNELLKALTDGLWELINDVAVSDLDDEDLERVSVDRLLLLKLASLIVTEDDLKAVGAQPAKF